MPTSILKITISKHEHLNCKKCNKQTLQHQLQNYNKQT